MRLLRPLTVGHELSSGLPAYLAIVAAGTVAT